MKVIRGRRAVVTGASSGIGRAIAVALAREGADVCLMGRDSAKLDAVAQEARTHGVEALVVPCDLAQSEQIDAAIETVRGQWPTVHILVNCAGIAYYGPTGFMTPEQFGAIIATNLLAPIKLMHEFIDALTVQREGHILNVASIFGLVTMRKGAAYQASKFGLIGFSNALRIELFRNNIGVTVLCPGFVDTPMLDNFATGTGKRHAIPRWLCATPEQVAETAIRAIRRNKGTVVMPMHARLLWWMMRLSPGLYDWMMREGWRRPRGP